MLKKIAIDLSMVTPLPRNVYSYHIILAKSKITTNDNNGYLTTTLPKSLPVTIGYIQPVSGPNLDLYGLKIEIMYR